MIEGDASAQTENVANYAIKKTAFILMSTLVGGAAGSKIGGLATGATAMGVAKRMESQKQMTMDAIAEIKILTSNYQSEFGRNGGGEEDQSRVDPPEAHL